MLLPIRLVAKPWGMTELPPPFTAPPGQRIGEIWFEPPAHLPQLLVKYIFTSDKLSVQVHPSDAQTLAAGLGRQGKEECWLVLATQPGARLGIGFREALSAQAMRAAALDGSIAHLLMWHDVAPGDFFYIPAGTVHAIGAGVSLIEVQQNSDITYRLYDYGRLDGGHLRELHLDEGLKVVHNEVYELARWHRRLGAGAQGAAERLVSGPHFRLDRVTGPLSDDLSARYTDAPLLVVPLLGDGAGEVAVAGRQVAPGGCALAKAIGEVALAPAAICLLAQPV